MGNRNCHRTPEEKLQIIEYAKLNGMERTCEKYKITETEALEQAILLQTNIDIKRGGKKMKIAIPTLEGKLCAHFGHCESFTFVEVDTEKKEILNIVETAPEEGISCQSASWIAAQGANVVLAGGMGGRPYTTLVQNGVDVVTGCPELDINEIVKLYLTNTLETGENTCGHDENHKCGGHGEGHHCGHHH